MADMARREILPAMERYLREIADAVAAKRAVDESLPCAYEMRLLKKLSALADLAASKTEALEQAQLCLGGVPELAEQAERIREEVLPRMCELRAVCDEAETLVAADRWPFPTYGELLFSVQ